MLIVAKGMTRLSDQQSACGNYQANARKYAVYMVSHRDDLPHSRAEHGETDDLRHRNNEPARISGKTTL
jgi:hypothetical protein